MTRAKLDVAGCGSMVVDRFYRTPRIIAADEKAVLVPHGMGGSIEQRAVGGVVLNHLGWCRVLGLETGIFGKMGDDANGRFLRDGMDRIGIRRHLTLDGSASAFATIFVDPRGNRAIYMARGATAELTAEEVRARHGAFLRKAGYVSTEISQLPLPTVIAILEVARRNSVPTVLDVDVPPADALAGLGTSRQLERALRLAAILKPAKAAARAIVGGSGDPLRMAERLRDRYGSEAVVITAGGAGCAISAGGVAIRVPAFRARPVDTTGAGDAFLGGMLAGLRWKMSWPEIGRLANAAGAVCTSRLGAFPSGFELRGEIEALYGARLPGAPTVTAEAAPPNPEPPTSEVSRFFEVATQELDALRGKLDIGSISKAVEMIRDAQTHGGRVHVTGVGKPEHVARYAASLMCSVGTPATFLHATETLHGSLGQVHPGDIVIAISKSGETAELLEAARAIIDNGGRLIAVTAHRRSPLASMSALLIPTPIRREGGGLGLAPRTSTLAQVLVLAGLSVALEAERGLTVEEYSRWHRAGALGVAARKMATRRRRSASPKTA